MFTLLEATNRILESLSLPLVDATTLNTTRESQVVLRKLEEKRLQALKLGWGFNTFCNDHTPNGTGKIVIDRNIIYRLRDYYKSTRYKIGNGGVLYDCFTDSTVFESEVKLRTIEHIDWNESPLWFQDFVIAWTSWSLRVILGGNIEDVNQVLQEEYIAYKATALQADIEESNINSEMYPIVGKLASFGFGKRFRDGYYL